MHSLSLRARIVLVLVLIVTVTSTLFAGGVLFMKVKLEEVVFANMVQNQLQTLITRLETDQYAPDQLFDHWALSYGPDIEALPDSILSLGPGSHHSVRASGRHYQVEVGEWRDQPIYLTYDITDWEQQEHQLLALLAYGIGILILVTLIMGWQSSLAILAPVRRLSDRLNAIQPRDRHIRIANEFQGSEIAPIASAFDRYQSRLDQFVDRERSFTAAASHELRTPLSVISGALDVLDTRQPDPATTRALSRIRRACGEMQAFIETTLFLSREDATTIDQGNPEPLYDIVNQVLEDNEELVRQQNVSVTVNGNRSITLVQPASLSKICIGNILRNAIEHSPGGNITVSLSEDSIRIEDNGEGISGENLPHVFDRDFTTKTGGIGLGLNLVRRICDRFHWRIEIDSQPGEGTRVDLSFT